MALQFGAALILRRSDGAVLVGTRTTKARSWPGTMAFPGGGIDDDDDELPLFTRTPGAEGKQRAAALRESLEEAGVVRIVDERGSVEGSVTGADDVIAAVRAGAKLNDALRARSLFLDDRGLVSLGSWLTAEGTFEVTRFLLASDEVRCVAPLVDELDNVAWRSPQACVDGWRDGSVFLLPPIRVVLHRLAAFERSDDVTALATALAQKPTEPERRRRDLVNGVVVVDTRTPTLWPATHTNCVVLGTGDVLLVDPATPWQDERARFDDVLSTILEGRKVGGIFLTHHHVDHVGDAARLQKKHGVPVFAHAETKSRVFDLDVSVVDDGHVFALPGPPGPGGGDRAFRCVFTPGHAPGHLCLFDEGARLLVAGDMVAGIGSILIDPPEGHMATYLRSLERLIALDPRALIPAHGPLLVDAVGKLSEQHAHRLKREAMVKAAIEAGASDVDAVVEAVYGSDTAPAMFAFAARSVAAIVEKLHEDGAVVSVDGRWQRAA